MLKIGIECENIEDLKSRWGVGHLVLNLIREYTRSPELQQRFQLYLYFKNSIPNDDFLNHPSLIKQIVNPSWLRSFTAFYQILLPIKAMADRLNVMFFPAYMLPPLYLGRTIVMLTNDVYYEYTEGQSPFRYKLAYRLFANWAAIRSNKVLAISETSKHQVANLFKINPNRIFVSHLGIDDKAGSWEMKMDYNFSYMLYVGQMLPRRRAKESILAFEKIAPQFPDLKFVLVGKDKYNPPIIGDIVREVNERLGSERVIYYDYIDSDQDLRGLYSHAKLFIYISSSEAFGLPPIEAATSGVPIIVKDDELNHELFGDAAFFIRDENNIDHIAETMTQGLTDENKRNYCITKYQELPAKFNWSNFANRFFDIVSS